MASSIISFPNPDSFTADDAALAARYVGNVSINGRMAASLSSEMEFLFDRRDGHTDAYSGDEMKAARWWRLLAPQTVLTIESWLYEDVQVGSDLPVCYVARSDRKAGGRLMPGTRLSPFFQGDDRTEIGQAVCSEVRRTTPDAGLFYSRCVEDAQRSLRGIDVRAERNELRIQAICSEQAAIRNHLGVQP